MAAVPALRVTAVNDAPVRARGDYVLYWMIAARRTAWNFALDHALARAVELGVPLVVLEPLRVGYPWASDRFHKFVLDGMVDNAAAFAAAGVAYHPYVEPEAGAGRGLLEALAARARVVVTDEQPGFFQPRMVAHAGTVLDVRLEQVDGSGLLPLRAHGREHTTAASFRWHWQKIIGPHLAHAPCPRPLARLPAVVKGAKIIPAVATRWPAPSAALLAGRGLERLPIDHTVSPVDDRGGSVAAGAQLAGFLERRLANYGARNQPEAEAASGLSPWLHFGQVSSHEISHAVWRDSDWDPARVDGTKATGSRDGWWGLPPAAESFMDELLTWRELGFGFAFYRPDFDRYESLPAWARTTLDAHASDPRPQVYTLAELEGARTHDPLWNAAQRQLVGEGRIHNYLRMVWGKKILEWSPTPRAALAALVELNNKYAVDGRDPNSYSGIFWTLGRFDRAWGPERPIFGTIRYMSSENTARKVKVKAYLARWGAQRPLC